MHADPEVGDIVDGKYIVEAVLGRGGMGTVVRARHRVLGNAVAIKLPRADLASDGEVVARALREARAAAHLRSEHVCRVLDVGTLGGVPYMVMDLLDGMDLHEILVQRQAPLAEGVAVAIVRQACDALAEAHELGVIHRDIKPRNLFLARARRGAIVKVIDFGISRVTSEALADGHALTTSKFLGSPSYVAPEQMLSAAAVDQRADVWALGVCLYQLATGEVPFKGETIVDLAVRIARDEVVPPSAIVPGLSPAFDAAVLGCLTKLRDERIADVAALLRALEGCAEAPPDALAALLPEPTSPEGVGDAGDPSALAPSALDPSSTIRTSGGAADDLAISVSEDASQVLATQRVASPREPRIDAVAVPVESAAAAPVPRRRGALPWVVGLASAALILVAASLLVSRTGGPSAEPRDDGVVAANAVAALPATVAAAGEVAAPAAASALPVASASATTSLPETVSAPPDVAASTTTPVSGTASTQVKKRPRPVRKPSTTRSDDGIPRVR